MRFRTAIITIIATAGIFLVGLAGVVLVGRLAQSLREGMSNEKAREQFVTAWRPPSDLQPDIIFPRTVSGYTAGPVQTNPVVKVPALDLPGFGTVYQRAGYTPVEVFAARATDLESEALFNRARAAFQGRTGTHSTIATPGRLRLSSSDPGETVELWSLQGWLFFFRATGELEADFIRAYLAAVKGRTAESAR